jgi:multiple sugar transport system substrate-binding protein
MWRDVAHFNFPDGPSGKTPTYHLVTSHAVMKYSKNVQAAKEFLKHIHSKEQFGKWFEVEYGFNVGSTTYWENNPLWSAIDEAMKPYRYTGRGTRMIGYAGPANAKAGEVYSKYVITDMFAKGVQGMKAEDAVKWAEGELKRVYES